MQEARTAFALRVLRDSLSAVVARVEKGFGQNAEEEDLLFAVSAELYNLEKRLSSRSQPSVPTEAALPVRTQYASSAVRTPNALSAVRTTVATPQQAEQGLPTTEIARSPVVNQAGSPAEPAAPSAPQTPARKRAASRTTSSTAKKRAASSKRLSCSECDKTYSNQGALGKHVRKHHSSDAPSGGAAEDSDVSGDEEDAAEYR